MKSSRKKDLREIREMLVSLNKDVIDRMCEIRERLETLQSDLEEQFDNLSERSQEGEAGGRVQDDIYDVESIISDVESISDSPEDDFESSVFSEIFRSIDDLLNKEY